MALSECFYTFFTALIVGLVYKLVKMGYKSKCRSIKFCGIDIKRDTAVEQNLDLELSASTDSTLDGTSIVLD